MWSTNTRKWINGHLLEAHFTVAVASEEVICPSPCHGNFQLGSSGPGPGWEVDGGFGRRVLTFQVRNADQTRRQH